MDKYKMKATNAIAKAFEKEDIEFRADNYKDLEILISHFYVKCGPYVEVECVVESGDTDNGDVGISIYSLIYRIPKEKRARAIEACNIINGRCRFARFYLNSYSMICVDYAICKKGMDESIGDIAVDAIDSMHSALNWYYEIIAKALYTDEDLEHYYYDEEAEKQTQKEEGIQTDKYKIKTTNIIAEEFEKNDINFTVSDSGDEEVITARYSIAAALDFDIKVFTNPENRGADICILGLIAGIPKEKRSRAIEACNILTDKNRFAKFYFDNDNQDINMEYDIYEGIPDEKLGKIVVDAIGYMMAILNKDYEILDKAVHTDEDIERYCYGGEADAVTNTGSSAE